MIHLRFLKDTQTRYGMKLAGQEVAIHVDSEEARHWIRQGMAEKFQPIIVQEAPVEFHEVEVPKKAKK